MSFREHLFRLNQSIQEDPDHDIDGIQVLITDATEDDIRNSSKQLTTLCHTLTDALVRTRRSVCGLNFMSIAIRKLQNDHCQLTQIHSDLCLLCLDSKCFNPAMKFLETDYISIMRSEDKDEDIKHVLLYYYYGGMIYAALKNFDRASFFFEVVLTTPVNVMCPIMDETFKKQIILNLLVSGKLNENMLPKYKSYCLPRSKRQAAHAYFKLAHEYASLNHDRISQLININKGIYQSDENLGLLKQCLTQVHRRNIQRLTKTFVTLPLRDVATRVGLASEKEAEMYILNMIDHGEIFATINQKNGMVVFEDNPEKYDSVAVFQRLQEDMATSMSLVNLLKRLEAETQSESKGVLSKFNSL